MGLDEEQYVPELLDGLLVGNVVIELEHSPHIVQVLLTLQLRQTSGRIHQMLARKSWSTVLT